ncbi:iron complex transport system permease protein [Actimicrobium sp. GrIS 1.19]|uniref:FecCD family ABC transporter permease n=1 Tax=Actimicrobium sp. GrIS 1.19 TaxID=3071708 RepID=UPI002E031871|nr:iron complex transport system permease protein [Actimicrobium sp. GrIS 1.19]
MTVARRAVLVWLVLTALGVLALAAAIACGSSGCFSGSADLLWALRLPRALSAFAVGGLLALAGALMQVLLRNPLADPYVLGVSGGAATGAMVAMLLAPVALAAWSTHLGAGLGALLATVLLFGLARGSMLQVHSADSGVRLILTGVMIAAGFGACMTLMLSIAPDASLRGMIFWLMGDLDNTLLYGPACVVLVLAVWWAGANAARLNVLAHGDAAAQLLGVPVVRLRIATLVVASIATATAVAVAGTIGFVGLVVPHALRLLFGNDQRLLLPACALGGGIALTLADLLARTVVAPVQLPVGVITALIGVPVFLWLLGRGRT